MVQIMAPLFTGFVIFAICWIFLSLSFIIFKNINFTVLVGFEGKSMEHLEESLRLCWPLMVAIISIYLWTIKT